MSTTHQPDQQSSSAPPQWPVFALASIISVILAYLTSRVNQLVWLVNAIGWLIAILTAFVPYLIPGNVGIQWEKIKHYFQKRRLPIYLIILGLLVIANILLYFIKPPLPPSFH